MTHDIFKEIVKHANARVNNTYHFKYNQTKKTSELYENYQRNKY